MLQYTLTSLPMQTEPQTWTGLPSHQWKQDLFFLGPLLEKSNPMGIPCGNGRAQLFSTSLSVTYSFQERCRRLNILSSQVYSEKAPWFSGFFLSHAKIAFVKARHASITVERRPVHKKAFKAALASFFFLLTWSSQFRDVNIGLRTLTKKSISQIICMLRV